MIYAELYQEPRPVVALEKRSGASLGAWASVQEVLSRGIVGGSSDRTEVRVEVFLAELNVIGAVRRRFNQKIDLGPALREQIQALAADQKQRQAALDAPVSSVSLSGLERQLVDAGFIRTLKPFQLANLARIVRLPHAADFSVPGAGKTTVALANHSVSRARGHVEQLLVIAPIAAFAAWKEEVEACLDPVPKLVVHQGATSPIPKSTQILLTNYNRVASDYDRIRDFVVRCPTQVILDEAHRIKRGSAGVHGRAVLDLAYAARRRDVLTGTPAPQGAHDLVAPVRFLYPGQDRKILPESAYNERNGRDEDVVRDTGNAISKYFVRTPKVRLGLPETEIILEPKEMRPIQRSIYEALIGRYRGEFALAVKERRDFDRLGRIVMYLLEAATNPALLVAGSDKDDEDGFLHPPLPVKGDAPLMRLLQQYRAHEVPWKYDRVRAIVGEEAVCGQKVLVWSTFVRNLRILRTFLKEYEPAVVHGGVPSVDGNPPTGAVTREAEFDRFRNDPSCKVLLANPAACGEGVSLQHWCHHAVYLDRTFNAGHYLQSQDRIHRIGLAEGTLTRFTLLVSQGTIDETVEGRLRDKIEAMAKLMNDPSLVRVSLPEPDEHAGGAAAADDDMQVVAAMLRS
ncbi:DEAD/DEAH box helicase [Actinomadura latina]|uniref:DEAD/DEAH box helicase n=1 Tax=Actinomadura latina TaxID=163603 RepID=A0A846YWX3_9ACTN|nr:DEAD/DEAH box helicase [Actinomadura latina]NKZ03155.1 DEAD/DEAH box helicase [Actinomadura latina]